MREGLSVRVAVAVLVGVWEGDTVSVGDGVGLGVMVRSARESPPISKYAADTHPSKPLSQSGSILTHV